MTSEYEDQVTSFVEAGKTLLDEWGQKAITAAAKFDGGTLTTDDVVGTWAAGTKVAMRGWAMMLTNLLDMAGPTPSVFVSPPFALPVEVMQATGGTKGISLTLDGPLTSVVDPTTQIPVDAVRCLPDVLGTGDDEFRVEITNEGLAAAQYQGTVHFTRNQQAEGSMTFFITVP